MKIWVQLLADLDDMVDQGWYVLFGRIGHPHHTVFQVYYDIVIGMQFLLQDFFGSLTDVK